jgi:hypothetical protein
MQQRLLLIILSVMPSINFDLPKILYPQIRCGQKAEEQELVDIELFLLLLYDDLFLRKVVGRVKDLEQLRPVDCGRDAGFINLIYN